MAQDSIGPDGRGITPRAIEPDGGHQVPRVSDDDDVEGHGIKPRASDDLGPDGVNFRQMPKASDEDDVEGHGRAR